MKYLIAGLGNIGPEYEVTRHNIGFIILDNFAEKHGASFSSGRFAFTSEVRYKGKSIHLIKPTTFMNLSGKAVNYWMKELKIPKENILVITDDLALSLGTVRLRLKGSSGGHNGLKNIEEVLESNEYPRLRVGIGSDFSKGRQVDYVLGRFTDKEMPELNPVIEKCCEGILSFCTVGPERTMNIVNTK